MADDVSSQLRPFTVDEWPLVSRAMSSVFAHDPSGPYQDEPSPIAELDRSLGLVEDGRVVATSGIYSMQLTVPGAVVPMAGVTWVTVSPTHRRRGILTAIMRRQLTELHEQEREAVAGLWAAEAPIYGRFGYGVASRRGGWTGRIERLRLRGDVDTGSGRVRIVEQDEFRGPAAAVHETLRRFVPGNTARDERWWDRALHDDPEQRHGATARRFALHTETDGSVTGYATYRVKEGWTDAAEPNGTLLVEDVRATSSAAYASLWQFLLAHDLMRTLEAPNLSSEDPLLHLLQDWRALNARTVDGLWVRLVDVGRALAARRYPTPIDLVIGVRDPFCPWNDGNWRLSGHPAGGYCGKTDRDPDLVLDIEALSSAYLGGISLGTLQAAGRVTEVSPGAVTMASTAFGWPVAPWCPEEF
ncbi:GNAT family N-acetyltransferase [Blastococcus sp. LR1]|uniref:GNAT family N-acetyltransferase n=1 Tax=Blastococcus sp. LR1 TaxID=2877000 RepID=UPI001CCB3A09|nr:GNAT family N-acetyltransferase [Blastococcus sp. LR1]MCA0144028.1 GNAT family N-acetyltransferase [Blastococcus sp. LR1]